MSFIELLHVLFSQLWSTGQPQSLQQLAWVSPLEHDPSPQNEIADKLILKPGMKVRFSPGFFSHTPLSLQE